MQFTYLVSDGTATARAAVIVPLVDPAADQPPIGRLDADIEVGAGAWVSVDVLANDQDPEGERLHLLQVIGVRHGSATIDGDEVSFTASEQGYVGDAGFSYVVGDDPNPAMANTTVASAQILVTGGANTAPTFTELSVDLPQGAERQVDLRGAVVDPDPDDEHTGSTTCEVVGDGLRRRPRRTACCAVSAPTDATGRGHRSGGGGGLRRRGRGRRHRAGADRQPPTSPWPPWVPDSARTLQGEAGRLSTCWPTTPTPSPLPPPSVTTVGYALRRGRPGQRVLGGRLYVHPEPLTSSGRPRSPTPSATRRATRRGRCRAR